MIIAPYLKRIKYEHSIDRITLFNGKLTKREGTDLVEEIIPTEKQFRQILKNEFQIEL